MSDWGRCHLLEMRQGQRAGVPRVRNAALPSSHGRFNRRRQRTIGLEIQATNHDIQPLLSSSDGCRQIKLRAAQHGSGWSRLALGFVDGRRWSRWRWDNNRGVGHPSILPDRILTENGRYLRRPREDILSALRNLSTNDAPLAVAGRGGLAEAEMFG